MYTKKSTANTVISKPPIVYHDFCNMTADNWERFGANLIQLFLDNHLRCAILPIVKTYIRGNGSKIFCTIDAWQNTELAIILGYNSLLRYKKNELIFDRSCLKTAVVHGQLEALLIMLRKRDNWQAADYHAIVDLAIDISSYMCIMAFEDCGVDPELRRYFLKTYARSTDMKYYYSIVALFPGTHISLNTKDVTETYLEWTM